MSNSARLPDDVSRETSALLGLYAREVQKWNRKINLISSATVEAIWQRHILDSSQLFTHVRPTDKIWADMGSGAGFPGLVLAILARQFRPDMQFILIERDQRKAEFLKHVSRLAQTRTAVSARSVEALEPLNADIISARALAPLDRLLTLAHPHLKPTGLCLFQKGRNAESELTHARTLWHMNVEAHPSVTEPDSTVLKIESIRHA